MQSLSRVRGDPNTPGTRRRRLRIVGQVGRGQHTIYTCRPVCQCITTPPPHALSQLKVELQPEPLSPQSVARQKGAEFKAKRKCSGQLTTVFHSASILRSQHTLYFASDDGGRSGAAGKEPRHRRCPHEVSATRILIRRL
jgi:hypothetical protein